MARPFLTPALITLLSSVLLTTGVTLAEPAAAPDRAAASAASSPAPQSNADDTDTRVSRAAIAPAEPSVPPTPMPMNLPDNASASEVKDDYGFGIAGLIIGTLLVAAVIVGVVFLISRRSWSTSH